MSKEAAPPPDPRGSFGRNVLISYGFTVVFTVVSLANSIVIARFVGTEGRGLYALLMAVITLSFPFTNVGLHHAATWSIGQGTPKATLLRLLMSWNGLALLLGLAVSGATVSLFPDWQSSVPAMIAVAAAFALPANMFTGNIRGVLLGEKRAVRYHLVQLATSGSLLILNAVLLSRGRDWVLATIALSYVATASVLLLVMAPRLRGGPWPDRGLAKKTFRFGASAAGTEMAETALMRVDFLIVAPILSVAAVGLYATAFQISHILAWGGLVAGRMMLAESANDPDGTKARAKLELAVRVLIAVVSVACIVGAATGWWLIPALFGDEFAPSYFGLLLLLPASLFRGVYALISTYLTGRDRIRPVVRAGFVALAVDVGGCVVAAYFFGWLAVAGVRSAAYLLQFALTYRGYVAETGEHLRWILSREDIRTVRRWVGGRLRRAQT